jgi:hypothetical protein
VRIIDIWVGIRSSLWAVHSSSKLACKRRLNMKDIERHELYAILWVVQLLQRYLVPSYPRVHQYIHFTRCVYRLFFRLQDVSSGKSLQHTLGWLAYPSGRKSWVRSQSRMTWCTEGPAVGPSPRSCSRTSGTPGPRVNHACGPRAAVRWDGVSLWDSSLWIPKRHKETKGQCDAKKVLTTRLVNGRSPTFRRGNAKER